MPPYRHARRAPRWRQSGLLLVLALSLVGCTSSRGPAGEQADVPGRASTPLAASLLPDAPGDLLAREDLQTLIERQSRRDTLALVAALFSDDATLRARAALGLGSVRAASAVPALVPLLADRDAVVRAFAAFALGQSGDVVLTGPLLDALRSERDPIVLRQLLDALARTGDRSALAAVATSSLPPALEPARAVAIARFGMRGIHDPGALDRLAQGLASERSEVLVASAYYFARVADTSAWRGQAGDVLGATTRLAPDHPAQLNLSVATARLGTEASQAALLRLLGASPDWRIRVNAARGLAGAPAGSRRLASLLTALEDENHHWAATAAQAIGASGDPGAANRARLRSWMADNLEQWLVWTAFLPALPLADQKEAIRLAGSDLPEHMRPFARAAAARALATSDEADALGLLVDLAADPDVRVAAAGLQTLAVRWAADRSASRAELLFPVFAEAVRRTDVATVSAVAATLADSFFLALGSGEVMRETYAGMEVPQDVEPMTAIVSAHGAARDTSALTFLLGVALEGPHPVLRQAAAVALNQRFGEGVHFEAVGLSVPAFPRIDWAYLQSLGSEPRLVLDTDRGRVVLVLYPQWAPVTVQAITRLARSRKYDGVPFHRVVPNFVAQGGDFARADGFGGPEYFLPSEFTTLQYGAGTLGMASSGPDTEGSQFFVTHSPQPHLEGGYTIFGQVIEGQDVVDALRVGDRVTRARVEPSR